MLFGLIYFSFCQDMLGSRALNQFQSSPRATPAQPQTNPKLPQAKQPTYQPNQQHKPKDLLLLLLLQREWQGSSLRNWLGPGRETRPLHIIACQSNVSWHEGTRDLRESICQGLAEYQCVILKRPPGFKGRVMGGHEGPYLNNLYNLYNHYDPCDPCSYPMSPCMEP